MDHPTKLSVSLTRLLVFAMLLAVVKCEFKLMLLHTNDMHSRFEETNVHSGQCVRGRGPCYGGFARLKTAVEATRAEAKAKGYSSIFLNAGDSFQGTVFYTLFKWRIVSELVNMLGIDVMSLGNHEFDDGPQDLAPFLLHSTVPVVCANIDYSEEPALASDPTIPQKITPSHVLDVDGVKVGVVGYLTPETKFLSQTGKVKLEDEIPAIKREVARLKKDGVKIFIALGHSGYKTDKVIAEQVPDLDIVVGGHTNTFLYRNPKNPNEKVPDIEKVEGPYPTVVTQPSGRKVLVLQAYAYTKYLGRLGLVFDDEGEIVASEGFPILVNETFKKDGEVERAVLKYANEIKERTGRKIGSTKSLLEADDKTCRLRECNFGNLATDAIVYANAQDFVGKGWTDAPIGIIQGGSFRASIDAELTGGDITYANLLTTLPFLNSVEKLTISGEVLRRALEHSVKRYDPEERVGAFLQYSGVHVQYDLSQPPGHRVVSAQVRCGDCKVPQYSPLDTSKQYRILTSSYLADGGDGYDMLKEASERTVLAFTDVDAVENYLSKRSPVFPEVNGRITISGVPTPSTSNSSATTTTYSTLTALLWLVVLRLTV